MTKPLTQKAQVAIFVRYQPNCAVGDICEALDMSSAASGKLLRELSNEGVLVRARSGGQFMYTAAPDAVIPDVILPCMVEKSDPVRMQSAEQKAKALEEKGLWRRAAAVYTDMFGIAGSAVEVARIAKRRKVCLRMAGRA
ncbi:PerC family transcriptional regulator [Enterobacter hormaechei]